MGVPNKLSPLTGGGSILPVGYLTAEFLESTGTQVIQTGIIPTTKTGFKCKVQETTASGMQCWYCGCQTSADGYWLTSRGQNSGKLSIQVGANGYGLIAIEDNATDMNAVEAACNFYNSGTAGRLDNQSKITMRGDWARDFTLFQAAYGTGTGYDPTRPMRIFYFSLTEGDKLVRDFIPVLDSIGVPCMFDKVTKQSFRNAGTDQFIVGLTAYQARNLSKLPVTENGTLTVSLPWEAQWDAGVQNALSIATTNGWTIVVQYRDPEVATTNIPASFLESTGDQYIRTSIIPTASTGIEAEYEISKSATGRKNVIGSQTSGGRTMFILMGTGYGWNNSRVGVGVTNYARLNWKGNKLYENGTTVKELPALDFTPNLPFFMFCLNFSGSKDELTPQKIKWVKIDNGEKLISHFVPSLTADGVPCMHDKVATQSLSNSGSGQFIVGFDTAKQALKLATLPDVTAETDATKKSLTVSLPWEAQLVITGVPAALQVAADRGWTITVQYREAEVENVYYNKYAACKTVNDMKAVNPDYKTDLTAAGEWIYELPSLTNCDYMFSNSKLITKFVPNSLPKLSTTYFTFSSCPNLKIWYTRFPNNWSLDRCFYGSGLEVFDIDGEGIKATNLQLMCGQCKNLRVFNAVFTGKISTAVQTFDACILDKESVLRISTAMPGKSGVTFTIGIHIDHENDTEVLDALATMEANGWVVVPQWNGTATTQTASTFGLKRKPVYAKIVEIDGEQYLDWGHYATNWEENGYQEFASLEEAKEYFNINQTEEV